MAHDIAAEHVEIAPSARIGERVRIRGQRIAIGPEVSIADGVTIICDTLALGAGCKIAGNSRIVCPEIAWDEGASAGKDFTAELNDHFRVGRHSAFSRGVSVAGQGVEAGEFVWARDDITIGGGGNQGPDSYCVIGDHVTIVHRCFLNIAERITIGSNTALSANVAILTHGAWQPVLMGYPSAFAPVSVGSFVTVYLNSVILPGVTVGDYSTVGAGAVVNRDIPPHCLAAGNPAVIKRQDYPEKLTQQQQDQLVLDVLKDYILTLPPKRVTLVDDQLDTAGWFAVHHEDQTWRISFGQPAGGSDSPTISLAFGPAPALRDADAHFDLSNLTLTGHTSMLTEDLRDYLRRRAIRFATGEPFRGLPLANLWRLKSLAQGT